MKHAETSAASSNADERLLRIIAYWTCCFLAPIVILALTCAWNGVYPFGGESFLTADLRYQYFDLFAWFRRVLLGETSAFYLANTGLGTNSWGLVSYYLSSPFNLLLPLFDERHLTLFFWTITALKLGCAQVSTTWYLRRRFSATRTIAFALALCFTWSSWTTAQMSNVMWLDSLIILPLAAYATFVLVRDKRWLPLTVMFALAVITCWYTAYMLALFLCLLFIVELCMSSCSETGISMREALIRIGLFALATIAGLALAAFTFLPMVLCMLGSSAGTTFDNIFMTDFGSFMNGFFLGNWIGESSPQHYAGTLPLLLVVAFALTRGIPLRVKITALVVFALMLMSSFISPLLYIWSGFRMPTGFYCRITYMTAFLAIWMAGATCHLLDDAKHSQKTLALGATIVCACIIATLLSGILEHPARAMAMIALTIAFMILLLLSFHQRATLPRVACSVALCSLVFVELLYGAYVDWPQLYNRHPQLHHDVYELEAKTQLDELRAYDDALYRIDKTYTRADWAGLNEAASHNYLALSSYASSQSIAAIHMLGNLGCNIESTFSMRYANSVLLVDSLLGVKYVSAPTQPAGYLDVGLMTVSPTAEVGASPYQVGESKFYLNPGALPLGFGASPSSVGFALDGQDNPFERQNKLVSSLVGRSSFPYKRIDAVEETASPEKTTYIVEVPANSIGYVYTQPTTSDSFVLSIDDEAPFIDNWRWRHNVTALGDSEPEPTMHRVTIEPNTATKGDANTAPDATCLFYFLDMQQYLALMSELSSRPCVFSSFDSGHVSASYHADEDGYMLLTIPATEGWSLKVNGQSTAFSSMCDGALMLIPVSEGDNDILLDFVPPGFVIGSTVSCATLVLLCAYVAFRRKGERD